MQNTLFYGDNLDILRSREYFPNESVDLIYLDPPFNSARTYNVLFKDESGRHADAQIKAFEDTWHWGETAEATFRQLSTDAPASVMMLMPALRKIVGTNQMMAYLVMMTARLVELHRVLKPTGSLYLHCDPNASHYLKIVLDTIFGVEHFRNEITWKRSDSHNDARRQYASITDRILFYAKSPKAVFNRQYAEFPEKTLKNWYVYLEMPDGTCRRMTREERETQKIPPGARRFNADNLSSPSPRPNLTYEYKGYKPPANGWKVSYEKMVELDEKGLLLFPPNKDGRIMRKRYLDEQQGVLVSDLWSDIDQLRAKAKEALNYPTQKPVALLERIIQASSNPGDIVLDPFCGCGTAIAAAQKLGRRWIGIDITHLSIALQKYRLKDSFGLEAGRDYRVIGEPQDVASARALAADDRYQFQWWALSLVRARPLGGSEGDRSGKKGADKGVDGVINFIDGNGGRRDVRTALVQVKSGRVKSADIRDLIGALDREKAALGVFITLEAPTKDMEAEAAAAGVYHSAAWGRDYPRVQILTIEQLLAGAEVKMPQQYGTFKQAEKIARPDSAQDKKLL